MPVLFFYFLSPPPAWQTRRRAFISLRNGSVHLTSLGEVTMQKGDRLHQRLVPVEKAGGSPRRSTTSMVRPHVQGSGPASQGPGSPAARRPRAEPKKQGLLSRGKKLLKRLGAVK
ncbi:hypothetical protein PHYPO_G00237460 [Pangasianodon hypophthalmus]|uniref:Uncharacterized protein n=1 Tax=Pangasianodon hypophthalmus TaxID=310915 RepID=A0A5N5NJV9_PANHP|nr:hypothetical protein PHYPO_G00237460 [Pangasianodon hypophthalmus]